MKEIIEYAKGNPGALTFLMNIIMNPEKALVGLVVLQKLEKIPTLRGSNIYVLASDLCGYDDEKIIKLCRDCPDDILDDACSRQDYSGRALVAPYLN